MSLTAVMVYLTPNGLDFWEQQFRSIKLNHQVKEKHGWKMVLKAQEQEKKDQKGKRLKDELELKI